MERSVTCIVWIYGARKRESEVTSAGRSRGIKDRGMENF